MGVDVKSCVILENVRRECEERKFPRRARKDNAPLEECKGRNMEICGRWILKRSEQNPVDGEGSGYMCERALRFRDDPRNGRGGGTREIERQ